MNARSIYKRLMRDREMTFWGPRAPLLVRFPLSIMGPAPQFIPPGDENTRRGYFTKKCGVTREVTMFDRMVTSFDPRACREETSILGHYPKVHRLRYDEREQEWDWCTGVAVTFVGESQAPSKVEDVADAGVESYLAFDDWASKALEGQDAEDPVLRALQEARGMADGATHNLDLGNGWGYWLFTLKWARRSWTLCRFSNAIQRAFDEARKRNIDLRLHTPR